MSYSLKLPVQEETGVRPVHVEDETLVFYSAVSKKSPDLSKRLINLGQEELMEKKGGGSRVLS